MVMQKQNNPHHTLYLISRVAYTNKAVELRVPLFNCHHERAVCCHGYVEIKKLPGDLGQLGEGNCISEYILSA